MQGDFSRDTYDPKNRFVSVLMQQGRPLLDADWNEHNSIILDMFRKLTRDLIAWHGGADVKLSTNANGNDGLGPFRVRLDGTDVKIKGGRYYVDGLMAELGDAETDLTLPPDWSDTASAGLIHQLVYLDIYESLDFDARHRIPTNDPAMGGVETCVRRKLNVKIRGVFTDQEKGAFDALKSFDTLPALANAIDPRLNLPTLPMLKAWVSQGSDRIEECDDTRGGFSGLENQLYRVEIHRGGILPGDVTPTFKWSRNNGSNVYRATNLTVGPKSTITIHSGDAMAFKERWIEIIDSEKDIGFLVQVTAVELDAGKCVVTISQQTELTNAAASFKDRDLYVRCWDHLVQGPPMADNAGLVIEADKNVATQSIAYDIEDNIKIQFQWEASTCFKPGDYWLIPSRANTGDILWPVKDPTKANQERYDFVEAKSIEHHYAPLAHIADATTTPVLTDIRRPIA